MRILVTGGAGFIGSHLVDRLVARGDEVTVLDDCSSGRLGNLARSARAVRVVHGCVTESAQLERLVGGMGMVFHLAAVVGVRRTLEDSVRAMRVNAEGTANVLAACARDATPVVYTSSSEVYGDAAGPLDEDVPLAPGPLRRVRGGYACSKAYGEWLAQAYGREQGLPVLVVRLFNAVGARQSQRMVLPRFVRQAQSGVPITIHGDGTQRRCFADVADVVDALLALAAARSRWGSVVNIGGATEHSVLELADLVRAVVGRDVPLLHVPLESAFPAGGTDVLRRVPMLERLRAAIGWLPSRPLIESVHAVVAERSAELAATAPL